MLLFFPSIVVAVWATASPDVACRRRVCESNSLRLGARSVAAAMSESERPAPANAAELGPSEPRRNPAGAGSPVETATLAARWLDGSEALGGYSLRSFAGLLGGAALTGGLTGLGVATFKVSVAAVATTIYGEPAASVGMAVVDAAVLPQYTFLVPAAGGLAVAALRAACGPAGLGPGLAGHVSEATDGARPRPAASVARTAAAVATLGSGCSLGPEGPAVEWGIFTSRAVERLLEAPVLGLGSGASQNLRFRRQLLAAGAASGVAAGFNAPLAGIVFALEVVSDAVVVAARQACESEARAVASAELAAEAMGLPALSGGGGDDAAVAAVASAAAASASAELDVKGKASLSMITIASLVSALVVDVTLGQDLALRPAAMLPAPALEELPVYLLLCVALGGASGGVAVALSRATGAVRGLLGEAGGASAPLAALPAWLRPAAGGLFCGALGLAFPQVLFFGYSTLDAILAAGQDLADAAPSPLAPSGAAEAITLLGAKLLATAVCVGSGLVGGTFAPSLFLGAVLGVAFHSVATAGLDTAILALPGAGLAELAAYLPHLTAADSTSFASIGAAATLAAVFRAPLTASLLIFELTRGYELVLPLLAAAGTGPLVAIAFDEASRQRAAVAATVVEAHVDAAQPGVGGSGEGEGSGSR